MNINIYDEVKSAIKDALTEWFKENKNSIEKVHSKTENGSNLLTIRQFCEKHPFIREGGLRAKLYFRDYNGFSKCMAKSGKRVLIKEKEALEWFSNPPPEANWTYDQNQHPKFR